VQTILTPFAGERAFDGGVPGFGAFGDTDNSSALPGICHPRAPKPLATVKRLQTALRGLAQRSGDSNAGTPVDGLVGPHTLRAVNYAVPKYASADPLLASGRLTHPQIVSFAPQLASAVEQAPISAPAAPQMQAPAPAPTSSSPSFWQSVATGVAMYQQQNSGGRPMYPQAPAVYYPPAHMAPRQASVDIKAFIPAQYEHVKFNPATMMLVFGVGLAVVLVMQKKQAQGGK
jgi:hypothetical protein